jgi:hypothetical protein
VTQRKATHDMASLNQLAHAVHMLHEQAHGPTAMRTCVHEPCRSLIVDITLDETLDLFNGPAPATLPLPGETH